MGVTSCASLPLPAGRHLPAPRRASLGPAGPGREQPAACCSGAAGGQGQPPRGEDSPPGMRTAPQGSLSRSRRRLLSVFALFEGGGGGTTFCFPSGDSEGEARSALSPPRKALPPPAASPALPCGFPNKVGAGEVAVIVQPRFHRFLLRRGAAAELHAPLPQPCPLPPTPFGAARPPPAGGRPRPAPRCSPEAGGRKPRPRRRTSAHPRPAAGRRLHLPQRPRPARHGSARHGSARLCPARHRSAPPRGTGSSPPAPPPPLLGAEEGGGRRRRPPGAAWPGQGETPKR